MRAVMIAFRYSKTGVAAFMPHLGALRAFNLALRRAGLKVRLSEGFNPHELIFFSQPPPLGVRSFAEYGCADCDESPEEFSEKLNVVLSPGFSVERAAAVIKNPNFAGLKTAALYEFRCGAGFDPGAARDIAEAEEFFIDRPRDGSVVKTQVRDRILSLKVLGKNRAEAVLKCGNENLRPDLVAKKLVLGDKSGANDIDIVKKMMYTYEEVSKDAPPGDAARKAVRLRTLDQFFIC